MKKILIPIALSLGMFSCSVPLSYSSSMAEEDKNIQVLQVGKHELRKVYSVWPDAEPLYILHRYEFERLVERLNQCNKREEDGK